MGRKISTAKVRMRKLIVFFLLIFFCYPAGAGAAMFSYQDDDGVVHCTNITIDGRSRVQDVSKYKKIKVQPVEAGRAAHRQRVISASKQRPVTSSQLYEHIDRAASVHKIDPFLIKAIIKAESNFNPYAVSPDGAQGLMQLMPGTARDLRVTNPFDVEQNIHGGTRYFRQLLNSYHGNVELSLAAYNAGPARVKPHGTIPRIPETKAYVAKVMACYRAYRSGLSRLHFGRIHIRQLAIR